MEQPIDITTITNANWQLSAVEFGQVAIGNDDLLQSVHNILFTRKGEIPLDQQAGSNLYRYVDKPLNIVVPGVKAEIIDCINSQEPRLSVESVIPTFSNADGSVDFDITLNVVNTNQFLGYSLNLTSPANGLRSFRDEFTNDFG